MTPEQLAAVRARMAANRQPVYRGEQYSFCRGWNESLDFVEKVFKEVLGEEAKVRP